MDKTFVFVLLLTLMASVFCSGPAEEVIETTLTVQGWRGEDIQLPCHFKGEPAVVTWIQDSISNQRLRKADFFDEKFISREKGFSMDRNFSLVITDLKVADEGLYLCQVLLKNFDNFENSVILAVSSMASGHAIEECVDSQSHRSQCTSQFTPSSTTSTILTCVVSGFKPNISVLWTDESGDRINSMVSLQTTLFDGTYERFEKINVSATHRTERTYMCTATGDPLNGTSTKEITLVPISGKLENVGFIINGIPVISIPVATYALFLLAGRFPKCKQQKVSEESPPTAEESPPAAEESPLAVEESPPAVEESPPAAEESTPAAEESPPVVQVTTSNEHESHSVQWANVKLHCSRLDNVSTNHPRIPFWLYVFYRFALAVYFFVVLVTFVVHGAKTLGPKFLIYFPVWTYIATTCYVCFSVFIVGMNLKRRCKDKAAKGKIRYQIQWFLFNLTAAPSIVVAAFDRGTLYYEAFENLPISIYVSVVFLPAVVCSIEIFYTLIVVRFVHVLYSFLFLAIFLVFAFSYWAFGGTDPFGERHIHPILDFEDYPGVSTVYVVIVGLATMVVQAFLKGAYAFRVRYMDRKET